MIDNIFFNKFKNENYLLSPPINGLSDHDAQVLSFVLWCHQLDSCTPSPTSSVVELAYLSRFSSPTPLRLSLGLRLPSSYGQLARGRQCSEHLEIRFDRLFKILSGFLAAASEGFLGPRQAAWGSSSSMSIILIYPCVLLRRRVTS